ncbi:MBOAT family O-acyltransferase [Helicobacter saguini]|uniref:MBOAT family O-acyltransferase n=1 Tax=Helicobacter saguini TaxID=1548018 RepID=UPI00301E2476
MVLIYFSPEFAIVLLIFVCAYWWIFRHYGVKAQNSSILIFNYVILIWINPYFALVVGLYTLVIYLFSRLLYRFDYGIILLFCVSILVLILSFFKYFSSIKDSVIAIFAFVGLDFLADFIIFPLGISFYTFASITYLSEVYKNRKLENLKDLATYLSFFPTFISGPIMKSSFFFTQLHEYRIFSKMELIFVLIIFGLTKKVLFASYLQGFSDNILQNPADFSVISLLLGIYAYGLRLYCDFSGYVDLVSAFALMLGFHLPQNFNMPYAARNIRDFWGRWHITLSHFIRDFIYIPLGGNKRGFFLTQVFILISFAISGIWHGNSLNFLIWGLLHGVGLVVFNIFRFYKFSISLPYLSSFLTINFVMFAWVFFYFESFSDAIFYLESFYFNVAMPVSDNEVTILLILILAFLLYPFLKDIERKISIFLTKIPFIIQPFIFSFFLILIIGFSPSGIPNFIYAGF